MTTHALAGHTFADFYQTGTIAGVVVCCCCIIVAAILFSRRGRNRGADDGSNESSLPMTPAPQRTSSAVSVQVAPKRRRRRLNALQETYAQEDMVGVEPRGDSDRAYSVMVGRFRPDSHLSHDAQPSSDSPYGGLSNTSSTMAGDSEYAVPVLDGGVAYTVPVMRDVDDEDGEAAGYTSAMPSDVKARF